MSKNVAILEGDVARRFNGVKKIQLHNTGGGTDYWVPESETRLVTKHINENGTYKAEDEEGHPYGYSQVTVSGIGTITGKANDGDIIDGVSLDEGDEVTIEKNENGNITVTLAPIGIKFDRLPSRLKYYDGDTINLAGAIIQAYIKGNNPWKGDRQHPNGIIPYDEIVLEPPKADISKSDASEGTVARNPETDALEPEQAELINFPIPIYKKLHWKSRWWENLFVVNGGYIFITKLTETGCDVYAVSDHVTTWEIHDLKTDPPTIRTYDVDNAVSKYGKQFYYARHPITMQANFEMDGQSAGDADPTFIGYYILYGSEISGFDGQEIIAKWGRVGDNKVLVDIFNIEVESKPSEND